MESSKKVHESSLVIALEFNSIVFLRSAASIHTHTQRERERERKRERERERERERCADESIHTDPCTSQLADFYTGSEKGLGQSESGYVCIKQQIECSISGQNR
jgi:hypothetical protein